MILKKPTVTIGIPAYNEESNIKNLLISLVKQNQTNFILRHIIVMSDGSNDATDKIVKRMQSSYPFIRLIADGKRLGHMKRLSQLYKINDSDIVIQTDADCLMSNNNVIEEIVEKFNNPKVVLVSGDTQPVMSETMFENLLNEWHRIWTNVRSDFNHGENIHNANSSILAMKKDFAKDVNMPSNMISSARYLYCLVKEKGLKFKYASEAVVNFRFPTNIHDYLLQKNRYSNEKNVLLKRFGNQIQKYYIIPKSKKLRALLLNFGINPLSTFMCLLLFSLISILPANPNLDQKKGIFQIAQSTKKGLKITKTIN